MIEKFIILCFAVLTVIAYSVWGEILPYRPCDQSSTCTIHQLKLNCRAVKNKPCVLKKNYKYAVETDFTPNFNSQNLTMKAYSIGSISKRFVDLPTNACGYAKCPVVSGEKQTFKYGLKVLSSYPDGTYEVKWLLGGDGGEQCCFIFNIQIKR